MIKICRNCKVEKPISEFYKEKGGKDGLRSACKDCRKKELNNWTERKKKNPGMYTQMKRRQRLKVIEKKLGVTEEMYNAMFKKQQGKCFICDRHQSELKRTLAVDHCHITNKIRGLLCGNCNTALGLVKENKQILKKMVSYLNKDIVL